MYSTTSLRNRLGFLILGTTNNFSSIVILSAAFDLLQESSPDLPILSQLLPNLNSTSQATVQTKCLDQSTSTILLSVALPTVLMKIFYPIMLVGGSTGFKTIATALLTALSFILTGLSKSQLLIFVGAICAALSSGLGEPTFLAITSTHGDSTMSAWSIGTGLSSLFGSVTYAFLKVYLTTLQIMMILLLVPASMLAAYYIIIVKEVSRDWPSTIDLIQGGPTDEQQLITGNDFGYGVKCYPTINQSELEDRPPDINSLMQKIRHLPRLFKYSIPVFIVFLAEFYTNSGLLEFVYYPEVESLDQAGQYRWFQVAFRAGGMIARCSLDCFRLNSLWTMAFLQTLTAVTFLAHVTKLIYIPSFELAMVIILYEGLIGGFIYVNSFNRVKRETHKDAHDFNFSIVAISESLGSTVAALIALSAHQHLCQFYD